MLRHGGAALGAERQLLGLLGVVRPPLARPRVGRTPLGNSHDRTRLQERTYARSAQHFCKGKRAILKPVLGAVNWTTRATCWTCRLSLGRIVRSCCRWSWDSRSTVKLVSGLNPCVRKCHHRRSDSKTTPGTPARDTSSLHFTSHCFQARSYSRGWRNPLSGIVSI